MINNFEIACFCIAANLVKNNYYPVSLKAMESWSNTEWVDKIYAFNPESSDETVEKHKSIDKLEFVTSPKWDTSTISQKDMIPQYEFALEYISNKDKNIILIILCTDMIFTDAFRDELRFRIQSLTERNYNHINLCMAKVPTKDVREKMRMHRNFYIYSALKFTPKIKWTKIVDNESKLVGPQGRKTLDNNYKWQNPLLSYENWFFTKEDWDLKRSKHAEWKDKWTYDDIAQMVYLNKLRKYKPIKMKYEDHPKEAQDLVDMLEPHHLGYNLFGYYKDPDSKNES